MRDITRDREVRIFGVYVCGVRGCIRRHRKPVHARTEHIVVEVCL